MVVLELDQIEVDHCLNCYGVWLDSGELELLLEGSENRERLMEAFKNDRGAAEEKIRCPICSKKMNKILVSGTRRVLIDSCPANDGLWFDSGELLGIVELGDFPGDRRVIDLIRDVFGKKG